jgi:S-methylmethionine-dependent homocysteine/selenocysteine methylase
LVREVIGADGLPLWISYTVQDDGRSAEARLRSGERVSEATEAAIALGASAVLFNCSQPEVMAAAIESACAVIGERAVRVGVYANAFPAQGDAEEANSNLHEIRKDLTPEGYLRFAREWAQRGADIIGGCCGIGPEHVAALRAGL